MIQKSLFEAEPASTSRFRARDYQMEAHAETWRQYEHGARGMICRQATGTGKTVTASILIQQWLDRSPRNRAMVIADQRQLVWQFADEIADVTGVQPRIDMGDRRVFATEDPQIVVASRQSLLERNVGGRRTSRLFAYDNTLNWLIIPDECHRWSPKLKSVKPILDYFGHNPQTLWFGLTATPYRTDGVSLERMFPKIVLDYPLISFEGNRCAVAEGWAVKYKQHFIRLKGVDFTQLPDQQGDWDAAAMEQAILKEENMRSYCQPVLDLVGERRTLIFNPGVEMARKVASWINAQFDGEPRAKFLDGSFPDEVRRDVYQQHKTGQFQFLSVCGLCREGYNDPGIGAVAIFRQTKSQSLGEQMKGRGCRPIERLDHLRTIEERLAAIAASSKPDCLIIDLVGISGMPDGAATADIYAQGIKENRDEVCARANRKLANGETDVMKAIADSQTEIAAEKKSAEEAERERQAREEANSAKAREELARKLKEEEEEYRRARALGARANYTSTIVDSGGGGAVMINGRMVVLATPAQRAAVARAGISFDPTVMTKKTASRVIGQLRSGMSVEEVRRKNRLTSRKNSGPSSRRSQRSQQPTLPPQGERRAEIADVVDVNRLLQESWRGGRGE